MELNITAIVFSGIATITSLAALILSIYHKKAENRHVFYSKLEEGLSDILFNKYPKYLEIFIDRSFRKINIQEYGNIDDCFAELYSIINCLEYLNDKEYKSLRKTISDLEDTLMFIKNEGYNDSKVESALSRSKDLYRSFKKFSLKH